MRGAPPSLAEALQYAYSAHRAGQYSEAERVYRLILRSQPKQFDALHLLGVLEAERGRADEAIRLFGRAINVNPRSAEALSNRANVLRDLKRYGEALESLDRALAIKPDFPEALNNRGNVLHSLGRFDEALESYDRALAFRPQYPKALVNRAEVLREFKRYDEAVANCDSALAMSPNFAEALNNRGRLLDELGRREEALADFDQALRIKPDYASAVANRSHVLQKLDRHEDALQCCDRLLAVTPRVAKVLCARGDALRALQRYEAALASYDQALAIEQADAYAFCGRADALLGLKRHQEALTACDRALEIEPNVPEAVHHRGNVLRDLHRDEEALANYAEAVWLKPDLIEAHYNLAELLREQGWREQALAHYQRMLSLEPDSAQGEFAMCVAQLPIAYRDEAEIAKCRADYENCLRSLDDAIKNSRLKGNLAAGLRSSLPFFLAYQGLDDRALQSLYGEIACRIMANRYPAAQLGGPPQAGEPVRVGIICGYFREHSVWKIPTKGWLSQLDRKRFRLFGYYTGAEQDAATATAATLCERFVQGPLSLDRWRDEILSDAPHVLIYPEIGMDGTSLTLAAQRLAAVQCNGLGHPVTSGLPTMDYALSSDLMEPSDAARHYTEQLVRLPNLAVYYEAPDAQTVRLDRSGLGARSDAVVYLSGQSLFKYLPQYDHVYPRIARDVGNCQFAFIAYHSGSEVTDIFRRRLDDAFGRFGLNAADYCIFLPRLDHGRFLAALGQSDVILDSIAWSGNNSTSESLVHSVPIVALKGRFMRGRHSAAILERMGVNETIAESIDDYVSIAVRLGREIERRKETRQRINEHKYRVYRDSECIAALENFLEKAVRTGP